MGHQIIRQPDGLYAVFSTETDQWARHDMTRDDLIGLAADDAAREARKTAVRLLDQVDENRAYPRPWALTFAQANAKSVESGGEDLSGKLAAAGGEQP